MGRPSDYSPELAAIICERITEEGSLRAALARDDMPDERTVYRWLVKHEEFRQIYAHAREAATEPDSEEMRRIAYAQDIKPDDKRVMVDVLKWQMARRAPKKWGDRQILAGDPGAPLQGMTEQQVDDRLRILMAKALDADLAGGDSRDG